MARTEADSWDLASSVGATATMVAAARALASKEVDALISDPYAEPLVRAVGVDFFTKLVDGTISLEDVDDGGAARHMASMMAVRTRFFDDFCLDAAAAGVRQVVILAAGLDARAYRLPWPDGTVVYELDQPQVIEAKTATMARIGAAATSDLRVVAIDLRDDWPSALGASGFDSTRPTAWTAEGLLLYLPPEAQERLFDDVSALSAPGSRLATEYHPDGGQGFAKRAGPLHEAWRKHGFDVKFDDLVFGGERTPVPDGLTARGWRVESHARPEMFERYGRTFPDAEDLASTRNSRSVTAIKD